MRECGLRIVKVLTNCYHLPTFVFHYAPLADVYFITIAQRNFAFTKKIANYLDRECNY